MTEFDLLELIGQADDKYIMESRRRPKKRGGFRWQAALAAVLALAVIGGAGAGIFRLGRNTLPSAKSTMTETASAAAEEADMAEEDRAAEVPAEMEENFGIAAGGAPVPMPEAAAPADAPADTGEAVEESAFASVVPLANAEYPESVDKEDYERASDIWVSNQVTEETHAAMNAFSYKTAAQVLRDGEGSGCFSPLSLYQTLSILASGAGGETRDQILSLLGQGDLDTLAQESGKLYRVNYQDNDVNKLQIANSLWLDNSGGNGSPVEYNRDWVLAAARDYYADVYAAEFAQEDTSLALGDWIARKTGGMLHPDPAALGFTDSTVMALVNTLWYKSPWAESFDESRTSSGDFTLASGDTVTCDFMHRTQDAGSVVQTARYTKSALRMDTGRMIFVLPAEGVDVEELLEEESLWEIFENGDYTGAEVVWSVPKFSTSVTYDLSGTAQSLGITDAFDADSADFSAISDTPLVLSRLQQGVHFSLNEDGVEAAAYTMAGLEEAGEAAEKPPRVEMDLNRPFLYLVTANDGSTLFIGVVRDPGN